MNPYNLPPLNDPNLGPAFIDLDNFFANQGTGQPANWVAFNDNSFVATNSVDAQKPTVTAANRGDFVGTRNLEFNAAVRAWLQGKADVTVLLIGASGGLRIPYAFASSVSLSDGWIEAESDGTNNIDLNDRRSGSSLALASSILWGTAYSGFVFQHGRTPNPLLVQRGSNAQTGITGAAVPIPALTYGTMGCGVLNTGVKYNHWNGQIGAMLFYDGILSAATRQAYLISLSDKRIVGTEGVSLYVP